MSLALDGRAALDSFDALSNDLGTFLDRKIGTLPGFLELSGTTGSGGSERMCAYSSRDRWGCRSGVS